MADIILAQNTLRENIAFRRYRIKCFLISIYMYLSQGLLTVQKRIVEKLLFLLQTIGIYQQQASKILYLKLNR